MPKTTTPARAGSLDQLLAAKEIAISCGPGGVGKTTLAAAAATMAALRQGGKVLVLTVDPAKRLVWPRTGVLLSYGIRTSGSTGAPDV